MHVTLSILDHELEKVPGKEPTYTEDGYEAYQKCKRAGCGMLFTLGDNPVQIDHPAVIPMLVRRADLPQTGDGSSLPGWASLLGVCCTGLALVLRRRRA